MPKRIEPKYGYQSEYLLRTRDHDFYSRTKIEEIAQKHEIDDVDGFERWANEAAHMLWLYKNNFDDMPRPKHVRAALREIRDLAEKLEDRLFRLDDVSWRFLWKPQTEVDQLAMQGAENSPYGHRITRWPCGERLVVRTAGRETAITMVGTDLAPIAGALARAREAQA